MNIKDATTDNGLAGLGEVSSVRTRPLVMVVDDDPVICCVLAGALNRASFDVEIFHNSLKALEAFADLEPDLLVVDWVMPECDGLSLLDRLKTQAPGLPAILITGHVENEIVDQARREGRVDLVLNKPFNLAQFLKAAAELVAQSGLVAKEPPARPQLEGGNGTGPLTGWLALDGVGAYFEHILDSLIDAVMMLDREGRLIYFNNGTRRMFCFRNQVGGGLTLQDICPADNNLLSLFPHFFGYHPPVQEQCEGYFVKADGARFYTIFSASLLQAGNHGSAVLLVVKDINANQPQGELTTAETRQLERLALTDPLTGIYNRRYFDQRMAEEFRRVERYGSPLTLIMIDFDYFKKINDRFGHLVGDQVLRQGAEVFSQALREVDSLSRWGGEEFMALLPETNGETGLAVAQRLHRLIGLPEQWENLAPDLRVTVSMGLISLPWQEGRQTSITEVLETIDRALYQAKKNGRNRIVRYVDDQDSFVDA